MTDEMEAKAENCRLAMKAAMEAIQDYCGTGEPEHGRYIRFAGEIIEYPESVQDILNSPAPPETQIERIAATPWAEETAKEQCESMFEGVQLEIDACIKWLSIDLARAVVFQREK
jgi:hypothetical protein